jgi:hypothetical protein
LLQRPRKTSQVEVDGERRKMQDFSQIIHFLSQDVSTLILEGKATSDQVLQALCLHAGRMSPRVPSELTIAVFVTLANWQQIRDGMTDKGKFLLLQQQKGFVRRCLAAMDDETNPLSALPLMDFRQLPANLRQAAFGDTLPVNMAESGVSMMQAAKTMPLRLTNRTVVTAASTGQLKEDAADDWTTRAITAAVKGAMAASQSFLGNDALVATAAKATTVVPSLPAEVRPPEMLALTNAPHAEMGQVDVVLPGEASKGSSIGSECCTPSGFGAGGKRGRRGNAIGGFKGSGTKGGG